MKKLYSLLLIAALCLLSQVAVAQVTVSTTNANNTTEKNNATWYVIRNVETGKFLKYIGSKFNMTLTEGTISDDGKTTAGLDSDNMFYFTGLNGSKDATAPSYTLPRKRLICAEFVFYLLVVLSPQSLRGLALRDSFGNINVTSSQTALTRAVLLISNKRSTLCVLSLLFAAKCSHKLGELPAGVRGMDIVVFYLFQVCFSQLFGGQKVHDRATTTRIQDNRLRVK